MSGYGTKLVVRRQRRDSDGDVVGAPIDTMTDGWEIAPVSSTEQADGTRDATADVLQAYGGPPDAPDIQPGDRVYLERDLDRRGRPLADGQGRPLPPPWHVVGNPDDWAGPDWDPGRVVTLQRHRG